MQSYTTMTDEEFKSEAKRRGYNLIKTSELKQLDDQAVVIDRIYEQCKTLQNDLEELDFDSITDMYTQLEQVTRERDAVIEQMRGYCAFCAFDDEKVHEHCYKCKQFIPFENDVESKEDCWEWRGVQEVE